MTARRIANVALYVLATVYGKRQGNPIFPGELTTSACAVANYALGYCRGRGRPNKAAGKAVGQETKVRVITSGEIVELLGELVGKPPPILPEPDAISGNYPKWNPTSAPDPATEAAIEAATRTREWFNFQRDLYRRADLLGTKIERMLRSEAGAHYRTGNWAWAAFGCH